MCQLLKYLTFLALISSGICLNFGNFLGLQREGREEPPKVPEISEVVETVRWRQSVCVVPGPNVPPCFTSFKKYENGYEKKSEERMEENAMDWRNEEEKHKRTIMEDVSQILTPKVTRLMEIHNLPSVDVQSSENEEHRPLNIRSATPGLEVAEARREGKYLIIAAAGSTPSSNTLPPAISVTKVLNSPVTATLVAKNCFPDMGVPLCENYQETLTIYRKPEHRDRHNNHHSHHHSHHRDYFFDQNEQHNSFMKNTKILLEKIKEISEPSSRSSKNDSTIIIQTLLKPQVMTLSEAHQIEVSSTTPRSNFFSSFINEHRPNLTVFGSNFSMNFFNKNNDTNRPGMSQVLAQSIQAAGSLLFDNVKETAVQVMSEAVNESHVVVVDKEPEIKPIVVLEHTPKPGLFANVWAPGPFNIFNRITVYDPSKKKHVTSNDESDEDVDSELSTLPTIGTSMETKISESLDKPENEYFENNFSDDNSTEAQSDQPYATSDQLVQNPTESDTNNKTEGKEKNIFGIGSLFPYFQNKPLIIERPGQPPLLIEKPIYVAEKIPFSSFFNFIRPADNQTLMNVDHEVIKDPVYVFEKPQSPTRFFHNLFGNSTKPSFFQGWFSNITGSLTGKEKNETTATKTSDTATYDIIHLNKKTVTSEPTEIEGTEKTTENKFSEVIQAEDTVIDSTEVETEKTPEIQVSTTPETTSTIIEKITTITPEISTVPEVVDVIEEIKEFNQQSEASETTETTLEVTGEIDTTTTEVPTIPEVAEVTEETKEFLAEVEASEKTETTSIGAEEIDTTTPEVSTVPESVEVAEENVEFVAEVELSNKTETTSIPAEQIDINRREVPTTPEFEDSETTPAASEVTTIPEVLEVTDEKTETLATVEVSETPEPASTVADEMVTEETEDPGSAAIFYAMEAAFEKNPEA